MGKSRARDAQRHRNSSLHSKKSNVKRRQHISQNGSLKQVVLPPAKVAKKNKTKPKPTSAAVTAVVQVQPQNRRARVPFVLRDNVLLVGEGDFSFALSLVKEYKPASVIATCFDSEQELLNKYPAVKDTLLQIEQQARSGGCTNHDADGDDDDGDDDDDDDDDSFEGFSPAETGAPTRDLTLLHNSGDLDLDLNQDHDEATTGDERILCRRIMYGIDATKLSTVHKKALLRPSGPFSKIVFNFPHVGGLSTDVNRQVRSNQQLLVGFFNSAKCLLLSPHDHGQYLHKTTRTPQKRYDEFDQEEEDTIIPMKGQILVTLFEGEPYTLWNIRDLARHCGLQVVESFKFPWSAYPGYRHARTAGDILTGRDRTGEGKRKGAWRGEEREARTYVIEVKNEDEPGNQQWQTRSACSKKNKRSDDHSSDEDD